MGPTVNYLETRDNPSSDLPQNNLGPNLNMAVWILTGAALVCLSLRLYCKLSIRRGLWWDDYVLIAASVGSSRQTATQSETFGLTNILRRRC